jgi:hypothetical protein
MANYSMTCTCGHVVTLEASSREDAVRQFQTMMTAEAIDQHFAERHSPSEPKPTVEQAHAMIAEMTQAAA